MSWLMKDTQVPPMCNHSHMISETLNIAHSGSAASECVCVCGVEWNGVVWSGMEWSGVEAPQGISGLKLCTQRPAMCEDEPSLASVCHWLFFLINVLVSLVFRCQDSQQQQSSDSHPLWLQQLLQIFML